MRLKFKDIHGFGMYVFDTTDGAMYSLYGGNNRKMKQYHDSHGRKYWRLTKILSLIHI